MTNHEIHTQLDMAIVLGRKLKFWLEADSSVIEAELTNLHTKKIEAEEYLLRAKKVSIAASKSAEKKLRWANIEYQKVLSQFEGISGKYEAEISAFLENSDFTEDELLELSTELTTAESEFLTTQKKAASSLDAFMNR